MMTFRASAQRISAIARMLDADAVVQSTVRRVGDSVHLSVELTRSGDQSRQWKHAFFASGRDIPALTAIAADSVAGQALSVSRVMQAALQPRPVDLAAFDFYIRGRYWWNKRGKGLQQSIGLFNNALDQDPTFAPAYAGMADAYVHLGYASLLRPDDAFPKARAAAQQAPRFDSSLAEPHAFSHFYLGRVLQARGSLDLALDQYRATGQLVNWVPTVAAIGHVYGTQGNTREARAILSKLDSLRHHDAYVTAYGIALVYASLGQRDSTFAWLERGVVERTHWMVWLRRDPRWEPVKRDPRFAALAERLRLPP